MNGHTRFLCGLSAVVLSTTACVRVHTKVEPIDINVNVKVKVDRELSDFFADLDTQDTTLQSGSEVEEGTL